MHFWVSAARVSRAGLAPALCETLGFSSPRKMGTNWFMPALVKSRPGESGMSDADGTIVWPCAAKKSRKDWRIWAEVMRRRTSYFVPQSRDSEGQRGRRTEDGTRGGKRGIGGPGPSGQR